MPADLLTRSAQLAEVRAPKREIILRAVAYDTYASVNDGLGIYDEAFQPGSFADSIAKRGDRVRLLRDHDTGKVVGRPVEYQDSRSALVIRMKVAATDLGDETLTLAADELISPSVGVEDRQLGRGKAGQRLKRTAVLLHEISLVPFAARDDAGVLQVRSDDSMPTALVTPNMDEVRAWLEERKARFQA